MKLLFIVSDFPPLRGGLSRLAYDLAMGFRESLGGNLILVAPSSAGSKPTERFPGRLHTYPRMRGLREGWAIFRISHLVRKHHPEAVLVMSWYPFGSVLRLLRVLIKVPYFVLVYGMDILPDQVAPRYRKEYLRWRFQPLARWVLRGSRGVFAISQFTRRRAEQLVGRKPPVDVTPPGIDPARFSNRNDSVSWKSEHGLDGNHLLLSVGRLDPYKGHDIVLAALAQLKDAELRWTYVIAGEGPARKHLERLVASFGFEDRVWFLGAVDDRELVRLYMACDLFLLLSREAPDRGDAEGFGIVFLEANAAGKAVIGGRSGGIPDAIVEGETGLLVDPVDPKAVRDAIHRLLEDRDLAERLGSQGRRRVLEGFTPVHATRRLLQLMDQRVRERQIS